MKSRSPPFATSFGLRLPSSARSPPSPAATVGTIAVGHYALTSNTKPSRRGGVRTPIGMQTLSRTLLTRRSQSLAACSVRSRLKTVGDGRCGRGRAGTIPSLTAKPRPAYQGRGGDVGPIICIRHVASGLRCLRGNISGIIITFKHLEKIPGQHVCFAQYFQPRRLAT